MKRELSRFKLTSQSFNRWMKIILIGLILSIFTTILLEFAMYFQTWGRFGQTDDTLQAFRFSIQFMERPQPYFSVLVFLILFILIIALINHLFAGITMYFVLMTVSIIAEYMKMKTRNEPILYSDLSEVTAIGQLSQMVDKTLFMVAITAILVLVIVVTVLEILLYKKKTNKFAKSVHEMMFHSTGERLAVICLSIVLLGMPFVSGSDNNRALLEHFGYEWQSANTGDDTMVNGPVMAFVSTISTVIMREPAGYSAQNMHQLERKYEHYADSLNQKRTNNLSGQTVISVLSESLTNPNNVQNLKYKGEDVYKNIKQIKRDSVFSGTMLSSGYGGGTANVEYMTLTGFPLNTYAPEMVVPYTQLVPYANKVPTLPGLFNEREVLHPYVGTFYNRRDAYKKMGIQKFYTVDSQKYRYPAKYAQALGDPGYTGDKNSYSYLIKKISDSSNKHSQFLQLMTMQNHTPYVPDKYHNNDYSVIEPTSLSDTARKQVETYITGVHYTDVETKNLVDKLETIKRPVTMIFYGDHWPGVFTFVDPNKQMEQSHETDYFIYQNKAARIQSKQTVKQNERAYASPSDFPALALQATNSKVSPLFALQTKVVKELPAFANYQRNSFVDNEGKQLTTKDLNKKQKKLLHELKLVQYDLSSGNNYLSQKFIK